VKDVQVIGAGISGLVAAWCLADAGCRVTVSDEAQGPGGLVQTVRTAEGLVERGPNALRWTETTEKWFGRLGIAPVFPHKVHRRRYVFRDGRARRWPIRPAETIRAGASLARAAATGTLAPRSGERVSTYVGRLAGPATLTWLVGPMLQGIYAAPPDRLSAEAVFGRRKSKSRGLATPANGMGDLVRRLVDGLETRGVRFEWNTRIDQLERGTPSLVCTNAPAAARLLEPHAAEAAASIGRVTMSDAASVTAFFDRTPGDLEGFGVLLPDAAGFCALGAVFNDCLFDGRSHLRSETWIFGAKAGGLDERSLVEVLMAERARLTGRERVPLATSVTTHRQALPVYDQTVLSIQPALGDLPPWIGVAGNYLGRIGLADLIEQAERAASRLVEYVRPHPVSRSA
jgi:oxygen-dependent protoporphyrinogen oxidase